ncbi:MAG: hypothetical protein ACYCY2_03360 [Acidithiobacillus ferriphilus]
MNTGELWFVRSKNKHSPEVELVEIVYLNGNVVGFGDAYYDLRLLDFVARDYEEEERLAQEKFMDALSKHEHHGKEEDTVTSPCGDGVVYPDPKQTYTPAIDFGPDSKICSINEPYSYQVASTPTKLSWWTRLKVWWISHAP